jgi:hypothetical protein
VSRRKGLIPAAVVAAFLVGLWGGSYSAATSDPVQRSNRFWAVSAVDGMAAEDYQSLEAISKSADLVVIGQVAKVSPGREWVANPSYVNDPVMKEFALARFATITITIERIIGPVNSPLPDKKNLSLEAFLPYPDAFKDLESNVPKERGLYFLRNKGPDDSVDFYRFTNDEQGLLREIDGHVVVSPTGESHYLSHLAGALFDDVVAQVAEARGTS